LTSSQALFLRSLKTQAADQSGFVGVGIVGTVLVVLTGWYLLKWVVHRTRKQRLMNQRISESHVGENLTETR